ncbi:MAG: hypothetical protein R3C15_19640 [Thermoleophilia bacterium]
MGPVALVGRSIGVAVVCLAGAAGAASCAGAEGRGDVGAACSQAATAPVEAASLIEAMRRAGVEVVPRDRTPICSAVGVAWFLSNVPLDDLASVDPDEEALVFCALRTEPLYPGNDVRRTDVEGRSSFFVANVECTLYPSRPDRAAEEISRVEAAMAEISGSLGSR